MSIAPNNTLLEHDLRQLQFITGLKGDDAVHEAITAFLAPRLEPDLTLLPDEDVREALAQYVNVTRKRYEITSHCGNGQVTQHDSDLFLSCDEVLVRFANAGQYDNQMSEQPFRWSDEFTLAAVEARPFQTYAAGDVRLVRFSIEATEA